MGDRLGIPSVVSFFLLFSKNRMGIFPESLRSVSVFYVAFSAGDSRSNHRSLNLEVRIQWPLRFVCCKFRAEFSFGFQKSSTCVAIFGGFKTKRVNEERYSNSWCLCNERCHQVGFRRIDFTRWHVVLIVCCSLTAIPRWIHQFSSDHWS